MLSFYIEIYKDSISKLKKCASKHTNEELELAKIKTEKEKKKKELEN